VTEAPPVEDPPPAAPTAEAGAAAEGRVSVTVLRVVASGAVRLLWWWPGLVVVMAAYAAVAIGLYHDSYPNLWGGLAAAVTAAMWYGSPLRAREARRRQRLRAGRAA